MPDTTQMQDQNERDSTTQETPSISGDGAMDKASMETTSGSSTNTTDVSGPGQLSLGNDSIDRLIEACRNRLENNINVMKAYTERVNHAPALITLGFGGKILVYWSNLNGRRVILETDYNEYEDGSTYHFYAYEGDKIELESESSAFDVDTWLEG